MNKLALLVYVMAAPTVAGILVIAALVAGVSAKAMVITALAGFVLAVPVAAAVSRRIA